MVDLRFDVESRPSVMERIIAATPRVTLGLAFVVIGLTKFGASSSWIRLFETIGLGQWFRYLTGGMQVAGGLLALLPKTAVAGAALIGGTMAGAVVVDIFIVHGGPIAVIPLALFVVAAGVGWQAWNRD